jgi:hypothetical protein
VYSTYMFKKIVILSCLFVALFIINTIVTLKLHRLTDKNKRIAVILEEIAVLSDFQPHVLGTSSDEYGDKDPRVATLKSFFRKHESPLYDHAEFIVTLSDTYGLDFRLLPAIAMQESNLCKKIPAGSYNCHGWGIYGGQVPHFSSYEESFTAVAKGLKKEYIDKGLVTPTDIMSKYNPTSAAAGGSWARGVNTFFEVLQ